MRLNATSRLVCMYPIGISCRMFCLMMNMTYLSEPVNYWTFFALRTHINIITCHIYLSTNNKVSSNRRRLTMLQADRSISMECKNTDDMSTYGNVVYDTNKVINL